MPRKARKCSVEGCNDKHYGRGYCIRHYQRWRKFGSPLLGGIVRGSTLAFINQCVKSPPDDCCIWPFSKISTGYGNFRLGEKNLLAHRYALSLYTGIPYDNELHALHAPEICHSPACINPKHLRWGTPAENASDKRTDGTLLRGETVAQSRLTESQAKEILLSKLSSDDLGKLFQVSRTTVANVRAGRSWAHLRRPEIDLL